MRAAYAIQYLLLDVPVEPLGMGQRLLARFTLLGRRVVLRSVRCRRLAIGTVLGVEMTICHIVLSRCSLPHSMRYRRTASSDDSAS